MLGVESRYGLSELIRICQIKNKSQNLVFWEYCSLEQLEVDLKVQDMSLASFTLFLERAKSNLDLGSRNEKKAIEAFESCRRLVEVVGKITKREISYPR